MDPARAGVAFELSTPNGGDDPFALHAMRLTALCLKNNTSCVDSIVPIPDQGLACVCADNCSNPHRQGFRQDVSISQIRDAEATFDSPSDEGDGDEDPCAGSV